MNVQVMQTKSMVTMANDQVKTTFTNLYFARDFMKYDHIWRRLYQNVTRIKQ